ncbi:hypothetical protein DICVIV_08352 [Dictyocaulus viviparus]|uniref:Uncharacterized protein n=1 Tax=Dictyocaulus viviparus TaxID=29172 RepID=A0A0D8XPA1_DICVI|nr:hypothetical protein DICVIV_08352 [Dictyocaulus viviparus]
MRNASKDEAKSAVASKKDGDKKEDAKKGAFHIQLPEDKTMMPQQGEDQKDGKPSKAPQNEHIKIPGNMQWTESAGTQLSYPPTSVQARKKIEPFFNRIGTVKEMLPIKC